jgi:hypothetical protein
VVSNAAYTRKRCPTSAVASMTPQEAWSGRRPNIDHMRIFGCVAYALNPSPNCSKFDATGTKCLLLGYCEDSKAYRLMCLDTKKIIKSQDVSFIANMNKVLMDKVLMVNFDSTNRFLMSEIGGRDVLKLLK